MKYLVLNPDNATISPFAKMSYVTSYDSVQRLRFFGKESWYHGVVVIPAAQLNSPKPELRFCGSSNPARGVSEICDGENL